MGVNSRDLVIGVSIVVEWPEEQLECERVQCRSLMNDAKYSSNVVPARAPGCHSKVAVSNTITSYLLGGVQHTCDAEIFHAVPRIVAAVVCKKSIQSTTCK